MRACAAATIMRLCSAKLEAGSGPEIAVHKPACSEPQRYSDRATEATAEPARKYGHSGVFVNNL